MAEDSFRTLTQYKSFIFDDLIKIINKVYNLHILYNVIYNVYFIHYKVYNLIFVV